MVLLLGTAFPTYLGIIILSGVGDVIYKIHQPETATNGENIANNHCWLWIAFNIKNTRQVDLGIYRNRWVSFFFFF